VSVQNVTNVNDLPPGFVAAHKHVLADGSLQFKLAPAIDNKPTEPPEWLKVIGRGLDAIFNGAGRYGVYVFWGLVALLLAVILVFILTQLGYIDLRRKRAKEEAAEPDWFMSEEPARKLLAEADALAAAARYDDAVHLLLLRSFEDIDARRPTLLKPAVTSREMALSEGIPASARDMFALIARQVEASLFGGRTLSESGWQECRAAYKKFALAGEWL
jgi:hypothetical protein